MMVKSRSQKWKEMANCYWNALLSFDVSSIGHNLSNFKNCDNFYSKIVTILDARRRTPDARPLNIPF